MKMEIIRRGEQALNLLPQIKTPVEVGLK